MTVQLYLVNPPARRGYSLERAQSGGIGVARKLKPLEKENLEVLPHDFLYQAAVAERDGHRVELIDLALEKIYEPGAGVAFARHVIERGRAQDPLAKQWIGVRLSMPTLRRDIHTANLLKAAF